MLFNFSTFNHGWQGRIIVQDITRTMGGQLVALGHEAIFTEEPVFIGRALGYNVILESFADNPNTMRAISAAYDGGCRFLYVGTEEPTPTGFNYGLEPAMIERQNAFVRAAPLCSGILHLVPGEATSAWYGRCAPAAYAELGFAPSLMVNEPEIEPTFDFGFYGKMTWRRDQILRTLEAMSGKRVLMLTGLDVPGPQRNEIMRKAKVIVQVRANEEWPTVSSTRCASALFFGRPVVAEPHGNSDPWDKVVHFSKTVESFYRDAIAMAAGNWRTAHDVQVARFANHLSPERCIGEPLRKIGVLQ